MNNRNGLGIIGVTAAVIVAVVGVSIVWAGFTSNLTINGSATAQGAKWSVIFKDLSGPSAGNNGGVTSTATTTSTATIDTANPTSITGIGISVKTPGDYVSYTFKIRNDGDFTAKIGEFTMPEPSCGSTSDGTKVCANLVYSLVYTDNSQAVTKNDTFAPGTERQVKLTLEYKASSDATQLPTNNVTIGNLNITIPFNQV